jgi:hypothetical protein
MTEDDEIFHLVAYHQG